MTALSIARTALRRMFRDRSNLFFVLVLPIALIMLIGAQFGGGFTPAIGVVSQDGDAIAEALSVAVGERYDVRRFEELEEVVSAVERGDLNAALVIPDGFAQALADGTSQEIGYVSIPDSAGQAIRASIEGSLIEVLGPVAVARSVSDSSGISLVDSSELVASVADDLPSIDVQTRTTGDALFPATLGQFDIGASTQLVLFMFLTGLTGSAALIQSRQLGVTRRMLASPTSPRTIIAGEALGRWSVSVFQGLYIAALTLLGFGVNWGDPIGAAAVLIVFGFVGAGAAMLFGAIFKNDQQAGGISVVAGLGLAALGGCMVPIEVFPPTMQRIAKFTPHAWANDAFAELVRRDGGLIDILPQLAVLAAFAAVLMGAASWRLRTVITR